MKYLFMGLIRIYQWTIGPLLGQRCKYWPSCSRYGYEAFARHGAFRGAGLTAWRILRCNPWSHGGIDEVPPARPRRRAGRFGRSDTGSPPSTPGSPPALASAPTIGARPQGAAE